MQAIVFQEGEWWVGQCVEKDLAVQSKTEAGVSDEFRDLFQAYKKLNYVMENHPTTPSSVIQRIQNLGKTIDIGEYAL
jgi:hypothetical protein